MRMMGLICLLFVFEAQSKASYPQLRDFLEMQGTYEREGIKIQVTQQFELILLDQKKKMATMTITTILNGENPQSEMMTGSLDQFFSSELAAKILTPEGCQAKGGTLENIQVKLGDFVACKIPNEGGFVWLGNLPFGYVKVQHQNSSGDVLTLEATCLDAQACSTH